jgi:hypothetical protein
MGRTLREDIQEWCDMLPEIGPIGRGLAEDLSAVLARHPVPSGKTVRVRIAIGIESAKRWAALGGSMYEGDSAVFDLEDYQAHRFITADVPLPVEPVEVDGTVES